MTDVHRGLLIGTLAFVGKALIIATMLAAALGVVQLGLGTAASMVACCCFSSRLCWLADGSDGFDGYLKTFLF